MFETGLAASVGILTLLALGWAIGLYNSLVQLRQNCEKAFHNIDVLLKQRHDELPKLLDFCRGAMAHEQGLLESVTTLRARCWRSDDGQQGRMREPAGGQAGLPSTLLPQDPGSGKK